jgi:Xaa-Pro aminopeptidase
VFLTDFRYVEQAAAQVGDTFDRREGPAKDLLEAVPALLAPGVTRLGFEERALSVARHDALREVLDARVEPVRAGAPVEDLRAVKDSEELARIREAARLADEALVEAVLEHGVVGRTERAVALDLEDAMRRRGASGPSFASIVACGAHAALPHAEPRDREIPRDTVLLVDWGAVLDGYCSDCTRTLATGALDDTSAEVYELVLRAQREALDAVRAGPTGPEVDAVAHRAIDGAGHAEHFGHGLGHGVGLEVHEGPRLSRTAPADEPLRAGNVVTVEPGVYLPGKVGVRIEDLVAVTADGREVYSSLTKELTEVA